jgi:hypothetical protein
VTASPDSGEEDRAERIDVLSADEEDVLAAIREIVARVRARRAPQGLEPFSDALVSAGASGPGAADDSGSWAFRLRGVSFSLRPSQSPGGIEVNFRPEGK